MTCRLAYGLRLSLMCSCQVGPFWPLGLLVLGPGIYALDNMLVTCDFGPNLSAHILDQYLWNSSNKHPMLTFIPFDARLLHDS